MNINQLEVRTRRVENPEDAGGPIPEKGIGPPAQKFSIRLRGEASYWTR